MNILKKIYDHRLYPVLLAAGYLCLLGIDVWFLDHGSKDEITGLLKIWVPWVLRIHFFLLLVATALCWKDFFRAAKGFFNQKGALLVLLFVFAFGMTALYTPRTHRIFYDEDIYGNVGQNIALANQTGYCNYGTFEYGEYFPHWITYNKEPNGWPFLISLVFQVFGVDEHYAFLLNNLIFAFGAVTAFFIGWHLSGRFFGAFLGGLAYALIPHNIVWSNTAAAEPSAALFTGLAVLALMVFLKTRQGRHLLVASLLIPFACQMRPESIFVAVLAVFVLLVVSPGVFAQKRVWTSGLLTTLFLLPHLLHVYAVSGHSWGAEGSTFSLAFLGHNLSTNGLYYLDGRHFPVVLTVLAGLGLFCSRGLGKWRMILPVWFLLFWGIFLFFYAGSYQYGADVRFALVSFMPLAVLAGMGGAWLRERLAALRWAVEPNQGGGEIEAATNQHGQRGVASALVIMLVAFTFIRFMPLVGRVGQEAWGARYDHLHAREFVSKIPERSIVLTQNPTMFLLWGQSAIQTYAGIDNPGLIEDLFKRYQGHVYFHYNYWCNTQNERNRRLCQGIKDRYHLEEVAAATERDFSYGLYRMRFKAAQEADEDKG